MMTGEKLDGVRVALWSGKLTTEGKSMNIKRPLNSPRHGIVFKCDGEETRLDIS